MSSEKATRISTFAVFDLETSNLPAFNFNKVGITELSIYAFSAHELRKDTQALASDDSIDVALPAKPRVLHKLTLLLNPQMMIHPESEKITGLNNYMLEYENPFNENTANTVLCFLRHLQQPICLVAHNGTSFDFPILKKAFDKLNMALPPKTYCVDSLHAFHDIDSVRPALLMPVPETVPATAEEVLATALPPDPLTENTQVNWQAINETTPQRPTLSREQAFTKRKLLAEAKDGDGDVENDGETPNAKKPAFSYGDREFNSRRCLFANNKPKGRRKYPPKGLYRLGNIYERIFKHAPEQAHFAESDVDMLMKLMLHYGSDFVAYAEERAIPFAEVRPLGSNY